MRSLILHIHLERRRLIIAGYLAYIAGFFLHAHLNAMVFGVSFPVFTGLVYLISVVLAGVATTYIIPNMRWLIECIAVSRLGYALCIVGVQGQEFAASPMLGALFVVGGAIVIHRLGGQINKISRSTDAQGLVFDVVEQIRAGLDWIDNKAEREIRSRADKMNAWPTVSITPIQTPLALVTRRNASIDC